MEGMVDVNSMAPTNAVEGQGAQVNTAQVPQQGADLLGAPTNQFGQAPEQPQTSWLDKLPEELRGKSTFSKFKDEASLAQAYDNLQSLMGKRMLDVPKDELVKHFSPEQMAEFYKAQGVPETPDAYEVQGLPDYLTQHPGVKDALQNAKALAHKHGVSGELFNEFVKMEYDLHQRAVQERQSANLAELSNTYGSNLTKANDIATKAAYALGGDAAVAQLAQSGLASHPMIFNMLYKAGMMMNQDNIPIQGVSSPTAADNAQAVRAQIKELYSDTNFYSKLASQSPNEVARMNELYSKLAQLESGR